MRSRKKGSVMPMVIIGLTVVTVIAFLLLSAVLYGNAAYRSSAAALDERLLLDEIGERFVRSESYADSVAAFEDFHEDVGVISANGSEVQTKKYNVLISFDNKMLIVRDESMTTLFTVVVMQTVESGESVRRVSVWTYGAYQGDS